MPKKNKTGKEATGKAAFNTYNDTEFAKQAGTPAGNAQLPTGQEKTGKAAFNTNNDLNK